ncbi:hypothetical protein GIB67_042216 [Kingdonia uniflora]|uniref:Uncharacterized protein n=1 Tax=Kingdonia uniflora TaxID=39325 RepID=A0A7J7LDU8_9MAGN|nr:hypothetical protein GIB67_042216 [Kingdonia uniflora]
MGIVLLHPPQTRPIATPIFCIQSLLSLRMRLWSDSIGYQMKVGPIKIVSIFNRQGIVMTC